MFPDWMEKYEHIIELGKELNLIEDSNKIDDNLIKGCQSRVWLSAELSDGGDVIFKADSDAIITKGLVALMIRVLSDAKPKDIASGNVNVPGGKASKSLKSNTKGHGAEKKGAGDTAANKKSTIGS